jgi:hypothetical protein
VKVANSFSSCPWRLIFASQNGTKEGTSRYNDQERAIVFKITFFNNQFFSSTINFGGKQVVVVMSYDSVKLLEPKKDSFMVGQAIIPKRLLLLIIYT